MIEELEIKVKGGDGGAGVVSFRREKFLPLGGPDGGDGGKGGSVYIVVDSRLFSFGPLSMHRSFRAGKGQPGSGGKRTGRDGEDVFISVPRGTLVYKVEGEEKVLLGDLVTEGERLLVARGGRGGLGNVHFATPVRQVPRQAIAGGKGEEFTLFLELRLVVDVGIIGRPNAGKSSLLSRLSQARPKIADYPFTTTDPELGVAEVGFKTFIIGEIPGLVSGAHLGKGLGLHSLRHTQRAKLLVHLLDGTSPSPRQDLEAVNQELSLYNQHLAEKRQIVVVNKADLPQVRRREPAIRGGLAGVTPLFFVSAATGQGVAELLAAVARELDGEVG